MRISELSNLSGVPSSTIRYYEKTGLLVPKRSSNGYRSYPDEAVSLLLLIIQAKALGFSLNEIKNLSKVLASTNKQGKLRKELEDKLLSLNDQIKKIKKFQKNIRELLDSNCPL
jgi:DNA-binding transcriptional MerR regulator